MLQCIRTKILEAGLNTKEDLRFHSKLIHVKAISSRKQGKQGKLGILWKLHRERGQEDFFYISTHKFIIPFSYSLT